MLSSNYWQLKRTIFGVLCFVAWGHMYAGWVQNVNFPITVADSAVADTSVCESLQNAANWRTHKQPEGDTLISVTQWTDESSKMSLRSIVLPPLLAVGATSLFVPEGWLAKRKYEIQDQLSSGRHATRIDDYLQYTPTLACYAFHFAGLKSQNTAWGMTKRLALSYAIMGTITTSSKYIFREKRPDSQARNSFPSGHTANVFFVQKSFAKSISIMHQGLLIPCMLLLL